MRRLGFALALAVLPSAAFADAVPNLNVAATCRATPAVNLDQQGTFDNCMRSENAARDRLAKSWNKMRGDWRSTCLKTTTLGGVPSYVELLTCVEMREAAANGQSGTASGSMTSGRSAGIGSSSPPGTPGFTGITPAPGSPSSDFRSGLGLGNPGSTDMSSGRSMGTGSPAMSGPAGSAGMAGAGAAAGSAGSAGSAGAGGAGGGAGGGGGGH